MPTRERPARKARLQAEAAIAKLNTGGKATKGRNTTPGGTKPSTRAQAEQGAEPLINQGLAGGHQEPGAQAEANPPQLMRGGDGKDDGGDKPEQKEEEASTAPLPEKVSCVLLKAYSITGVLLKLIDYNCYALEQCSGQPGHQLHSQRCTLQRNQQ